MPSVEQQAEEFAKRHPLLALLGLGAGVVVGKKEYDRRYHSKHHREKKEEDE